MTAKEETMFGRILIAVADDEIAEQVIHTAVSLAGALNAKLALVHVVDLAIAGAAASGPMEMGAGPIATQEIIEEQEHSGQRFLDRIAAQFPGGAVETLLREGAPASDIVAAAVEWHADLIVVGTHGRGGLGRLVLGSVAETVLREAPCPVLTIRVGTPPTA
jgi:nucleotide-binding universal stress UspA family protein